MEKRNLSKREKGCAIGLLTFLIVALVVGAKSVHAYYYSDSTTSEDAFALYVGDFYQVKGDISIDVYQEYVDIGAEGATKVYKKIDAIPNGGTISSVSCTNPKNGNQNVTCTANNGESCSYTYATNNFKLTSKTPVNCKVYFSKATPAA